MARIDRCLVLASLLLVLACGSSKPTPMTGATCAVNSDCNNPLSCTFGRCHAMCKEARDCPAGQRCVTSPMGGGVCQLNAQCIYRSDCPQPLACALDRQCRSQCVKDIDCPTRTQKCVQPDNVCAEPDEIDPGSGKLKQAQPGEVPPGPADAGTDAAPAADAAPADLTLAGDTAPATPDGPATADVAADSAPDTGAPTCNDGLKNGKETDIDCGGSCPACGPMKGCAAALDCASDVCGMDGKCATPSCTDNVLNGDETGIDCGGSCPACPMEATWGTSAATYRGMIGLHVSVHCPGMGTLGGVWGTDTYTDDSSICTAAVHAGLLTFAGGNVTIEIRDGQASYVGSARHNVTSNSYGSYVGSFVFFPLVTPNCGNLMKDGDETDADCGGAHCQACTGGHTCNSDADCGGTTCAGRCTVAADWTTNAVGFRGMNGARIPFACPAAGAPATIYGTDIYTDDSPICTAGVHAGKISLVGGGSVTIEIRAGQAAYTGSMRNGITSNDYGTWSGSYSVP